MRRYAQVSGTFFCLMAALQLMRLIFHWPVQIAATVVPLWPSILALLITVAFAAWGFRTARSSP